jgi:hypothetical protein
MNYKRPLVEKIDIFYILKQLKMVTRGELSTILPAQPYKEYAETYYRRRVMETFDRSYNKEWFLQRYIQDEDYNVRRERMLEFHAFAVPTACIRMRNIHPDISVEQIRSTAESCLCLEEYWMVQGDSTQRFFRECYMALKEGASVDDAIEFMNTVMNRELQLVFEKVDTRNLRRPRVEVEDRERGCLMRLFKALCLMYRIDDVEVLERYQSEERAESAQFMCDALRDVFLYCYACGVQYDAPLDMMIGCRNHGTRGAAERKREFLGDFRELFHPKARSMEEEVGKMMSRIEEGYYRCEFCGKAFQTAEFVHNHFNNKHKKEIREIEERVDAFNKFIGRIDCLMVSFMTGSDDEQLPRFVRSSFEDSRVIYDMGRLFSGEIAMDRQ